MKSKFNLLVVLCTLVSLQAFSQSIPPDYNNYNFKLGLKFIADKSNDNNFTPYRTTVYSFGSPISYKFNNSKSSIESGLYMITKAIGITEEESAILRNISLPVNYRMSSLGT